MRSSGDPRAADQRNHSDVDPFGDRLTSGRAAFVVLVAFMVSFLLTARAPA